MIWGFTTHFMTFFLIKGIFAKGLSAGGILKKVIPTKGKTGFHYCTNRKLKIYFKATKLTLNKRCLHDSKNPHRICLKRYLMNKSSRF